MRNRIPLARRPLDKLPSRSSSSSKRPVHSARPANSERSRVHSDPRVHHLLAHSAAIPIPITLPPQTLLVPILPLLAPLVPPLILPQITATRLVVAHPATLPPPRIPLEAPNQQPQAPLASHQQRRPPIHSEAPLQQLLPIPSPARPLQTTTQAIPSLAHLLRTPFHQGHLLRHLSPFRTHMRRTAPSSILLSTRTLTATWTAR